LNETDEHRLNYFCPLYPTDGLLLRENIEYHRVVTYTNNW